MTKGISPPIVVAVGMGPMDAALAFAAEEARAIGCPLQLVHVVHLPPSGQEVVLVGERDLERNGRQALNAGVARARELVPADVPVSAELSWGPIVPTLVDTAADARMIVLQRRDLSSVRRIVTRSVSSGVAARARMPVVSVPEHWSAERPEQNAAVVTVGVDVPNRSTEVLRAAAAEARRHGALLHVLHVWSFPPAYDDVALTAAEVEEWNTRAVEEIRPVVKSLDEATLGLSVQIDVRHAHVADALVDDSKTSDLLVIGRHDSRMPLGSHLGPVARAVLREAGCPVLLVDP